MADKGEYSKKRMKATIQRRVWQVETKYKRKVVRHILYISPKLAKQLVAITCCCHLRCPQKLSLSEHKHISDEFYKLKDNNAQNIYMGWFISRL